MITPNFQSQELAYLDPPDDVEQCESGDCDTCLACLAELAQDQADALTEGQWENWRAERGTRWT